MKQNSQNDSEMIPRPNRRSAFFQNDHFYLLLFEILHNNVNVDYNFDLFCEKNALWDFNSRLPSLNYAFISYLLKFDSNWQKKERINY